LSGTCPLNFFENWKEENGFVLDMFDTIDVTRKLNPLEVQNQISALKSQRHTTPTTPTPTLNSSTTPHQSAGSKQY